MVGKRVFEKFADDGAFVQRFVGVFQGGDEAAGVEGEERLGLVVGVYFDVLVGDFFLFEDGPGALDKGAAFSRIRAGVIEESQWLKYFHSFLEVDERTHNQPE